LTHVKEDDRGSKVVPGFGDVAHSIVSSFMNVSDATVEFTALLKNAARRPVGKLLGREGARFEFLTRMEDSVKDDELWCCS
jgi:hypothetical protein